MSERYSRLFSLSENLYATGSPVIISAGALLKDNQTGKILAQLKLTNIQYKKIKAVKVKLFPLDTMGQPLRDTVEYQYLDLQLTRDADFGSKTPIAFPDVTTRSFFVEVTTVVFTDNTAWNSDGSPWEPIPDRVAIHQRYDSLVIEQFRLEQSGTCQFVVQEHKDLWLCTCGAVNHDGETRCHDCGKQLSQIFPLDIDGLTERANLRLAEETQKAAEEKAEKEAAAAATKKKTAKILKIVVPVICAVVAFVILLNSVIIPNSKYNNALSLMEAEKYKQAINAFKALNGYKDSAEQIAKCENEIAAAEKAKIEAEIAAKFARAEELLAAGDYDGAITIYESLADYEGSAEGIAAAEEGKLETAYKAAEALAENGQPAQAAIAFNRLSGYKDAAEQSYSLWKKIAPNRTIAAGYNFIAGIQSDGNVTLSDAENVGFRYQNMTWNDVVTISTGDNYIVGINSDGTIPVYGHYNSFVLEWPNIVAISAGGFYTGLASSDTYHIVGLKSDGTVVAEGPNSYGKCNVSSWKDMIAVCSAEGHTVGLKADGTVLATGANKDGQCDVSSWNDIIAISAGGYSYDGGHTVGLKSDGTVVATGDNTYGRCNVSDWKDIIAISAGKFHTVGLKSDGTVVAVGHNDGGRCDVSQWKDIVAISAGGRHTVGLKSDGSIVVAGYYSKNVVPWTGNKLP